MLIKEPVTINTLTLRNRIVKAPCDTAGAVDGAPDENMAEHYRQRARGTGLIINLAGQDVNSGILPRTFFKRGLW